MLTLSSFAVNGNPETESDDSFGFLQSLQELKELRSQIHYAADYCEKSFLDAQDKSAVLDNTKEYLCRAVVTVVDHLGSVSTNLNHKLDKSDRVSEAELRINCLKQKLDSCDQFNQSFTLTKIRCCTGLPRFYSRYISSPPKSDNNESSLRSSEPNLQPTDTTSAINKEFKTDEDMPLFMYTSSNKISFDKSPTSPPEIDAKLLTGIAVPPVSEGVSVAPKLIRNPSFHFQESKRASGIRRRILQWKSTNRDNEIVSALKRRQYATRLLLKLRS